MQDDPDYAVQLIQPICIVVFMRNVEINLDFLFSDVVFRFHASFRVWFSGGMPSSLVFLMIFNLYSTMEHVIRFLQGQLYLDLCPPIFFCLPFFSSTFVE